MEGSIYRQIQDALKDAGLLQYLKLSELDNLIGKLRIRHFQKGETIISQGDKGDAFYIIAEGSVEVFVRKGLRKERVAILGPGEFFGEMALITHDRRSATVVVKDRALVFILHEADFASILMKNPEALKLLRQVASERKRKSSG
jgi:CRP-like cAMP-binding protein